MKRMRKKRDRTKGESSLGDNKDTDRTPLAKDDRKMSAIKVNEGSNP